MNREIGIRLAIGTRVSTRRNGKVWNGTVIDASKAHLGTVRVHWGRNGGRKHESIDALTLQYKRNP